MKKRILSFVLALCFVFTLIPAAFADSETVSGECGDNLTWTLKDGTLTISGTGDVDYSDYAPWEKFKDQITKVIITQGVTSIKTWGAFSCCDNLVSVQLPNGLKSMGESAFQGCTSLKDIRIPEGVVSIEDGTFYRCENLASITLPESLKTIEHGAFEECNSLESITIPSGVTKISITSIACAKLENINVSADNKAYSSENGVLFNKDKTELIRYPEAKVGDSYTVPSSVVSIATFAFSSSNLKSITLPNGLKSIGGAVFSLCEELRNLNIPDSVTDLGAAAFVRCSELTTVVIPNSVSKISYNTFVDCGSLKSVAIPTSVKSIEERAFDGCSSLSDIYYGGTFAQWNAVEINNLDDSNEALKNATIHFKAPHVHSLTTSVIAPTCTEKGYTTHTCVSCGNSYKDSYTNALGHSYKNGKCTICGAADPNYKPAPKAPELKITTSAGKPKISWSAVDGAAKYWVYRSTDGKNFRYYDSTTKTSYTNNSTSIGTTYYYKVKAVAVVDGKNYASDYSVSKGILCKPAAPTVSINRSNGKPKLSWKAVSGATKYWIYRSTDGVNFKYWDSTTKTSYTNSGAASGTKYYYRVKAVAVVNGKNVVSANSSTKSLFTSLAKPSVSITTANGKPKLTWNAVTGADKYYIYRSTDGKNFSYWDSTTKTSYVNTGAKKNTKYYYKVKAVCASNSNANSAQSATVSIKATK